MPDDLLRDLRTPNHASTADASKNPTMGNLRYPLPIIDDLFHPIRHRHCVDVPSLSDEINNGPMIFPPLNVVEVQIDELSSPKTTTEKHCRNSAIPRAFHTVHAGKLPQRAGFFYGQPIPKSHA